MTQQLTPDYGWVYWDHQAEAWTIECWACEKGPLIADSFLADSSIKAILLRAAERHNKEHHHG